MIVRGTIRIRMFAVAWSLVFMLFRKSCISSPTRSGDVIAQIKSSANKVETNESDLAAEKRKQCANYVKKQNKQKKENEPMPFSKSPPKWENINSTKKERKSRVLQPLEVHQFVVCGCEASVQLGLLVKEWVHVCHLCTSSVSNTSMEMLSVL